jgi:ABC-type multidrug transport system fused ATPase/permease subunit
MTDRPPPPLARVIAWFLRPYAGTVALIFAALFAATLLETAAIAAFYPLLSGVLPGAGAAGAGGRALALLEAAAARMPGEGVVAASLLLVALVLAAALAGFLAESFAMWHRYKLLEDFLNAVYRRVTGNDYRYFLEKRHGELVYLGVNAAQAVGEMLMYFPKVGLELFRLLTITALLLTISVKVTLAVVVLMALFGAVVHLLSTLVIHPVAVRVQRADAGVTAVFSETMSGVKQIKVFDGFAYWRAEFARQAREMRSANTLNAVAGFLPARLIMVVGAASVAGAVLYVRLSRPDQLAAFLPIMAVYALALQRMMPAINSIGSYWMGLRGLGPRLELTHRTLTEAEHRPKDGAAEFPGLRQGLRLEDVSFSYPTRAGVLKGVTLDIPKGSTVAVVGESGSGKSTLADLLLRVYEPTSGRLLADGRDAAEFTASSWLARFGTVAQESFIFHASVKDNILMGRSGADDAAVRRAGETACADRFIAELPEGYDTVVGDRGVKLSGGQRQRLAIARAVLRDPEVLVLDEATSALDTVSEGAVQEALARAGAGRTTVVIAHRLSTVEKADRIVVLAAGEVVEQGTHAELLAKRGAYHRLYEKQRREEPA